MKLLFFVTLFAAIVMLTGCVASSSNVSMDRETYDEFKRDYLEIRPIILAAEQDEFLYTAELRERLKTLRERIEAQDELIQVALEDGRLPHEAVDNFARLIIAILPLVL